MLTRSRTMAAPEAAGEIARMERVSDTPRPTNAVETAPNVDPTVLCYSIRDYTITDTNIVTACLDNLAYESTFGMFCSTGSKFWSNAHPHCSY